MLKTYLRSLLPNAAVISVILLHLTGFSQEPMPFNLGFPLTKSDSLYASKLPKLKLPSTYEIRGIQNLPYQVNNAELPFFRPVFSQEEYWNCGKSAGVGYNFCYEIKK